MLMVTLQFRLMKMLKGGQALNLLSKKVELTLNNKYYTFNSGKLYEHN